MAIRSPWAHIQGRMNLNIPLFPASSQPQVSKSSWEHLDNQVVTWQNSLYFLIRGHLSNLFLASYFWRKILREHLCSLLCKASDSWLPRWLSAKYSTCQCRRCRRCRRCGFDPWVEKIPWRRKWQPTPVSLPGDFMDGLAWWAIVHWVTKNWTQLNNWAQIHITFSGF